MIEFRPFSDVHAFFRTVLPRSGELSPGEWYDAVGVNCKRGATTENQGAGAWYMG